MPLVLVADNILAAADYMAATLAQAGFETRAADCQTEAMAIYQERRADLVLTGYYLREGNGIGLLRALARVDPDFLGVMATGVGSEEIARAAMLSGASDYVVRDGDFYRELPGMARRYIEGHRDLLEERRARAGDERLEAQVELAGWLDHNFKNILSAAAGSLSLLDFANPAQTDGKRREYVSDTMEAVRAAMGLLDSLSELGRAGSRAGARAVLVSRAADEAYAAATDPSRARPEDRAAFSATVSRTSFVNASRALPPQRVVHEDLATVLEALFRNSLESLASVQESPEITLAAEREGSRLVFEVRDNGRGMDAKILRRAFDPLFSTKGQVGVGVSLAIVKTLIQRHRGEIAIRSEPGKGTAVRFTYFVGEDGPLADPPPGAGW
ncbi:MAG: response regulator [Deltaproteobacteria bacterium]|nr:response regulator [Deltaproteobacteria bacterium]